MSIVLASFARTLEREAATLRADCSAHAKARHDAELLAESLRADRDALAAALSICLTSMARCDELIHNAPMMEANAVLAKHGG